MESTLKPIPGQLHFWKDVNWGSRMERGTGTCLNAVSKSEYMRTCLQGSGEAATDIL